MRLFIRIVLGLLLLLAVVVAIALVWGRSQLHGSLPLLEGRQQLPGLIAAVRVTRDALGIPTVQAFNRLDAARATGFLHAQDRFFQMDLARRRAAGELAALVGARAVPADRDIRIHRFRAQAARALSLLAQSERELIDAYTAGANAGLRALRTPPFEYLVLRQQPAPWKPEDTLLVVLSMFVTLQDDDGSYEATLATMSELLPAPMVEFLAPRGSEWDAPLTGTSFEVPPIPGADVYDLRSRRTGKKPPVVPQQLDFERVRMDEAWPFWSGDRERDDGALGSNNFAVAGRLTGDGGALVANDMHLTIRVPNTWYRASLEWHDPEAPDNPQRLTGVTLPGVPAMVVGSNTHVAWGFTNTYADWSDIVPLDVDPGRPAGYRTPDGWREYEQFVEVIDVAGESSISHPVAWTIWGPLLERDFRGRPRAYQWVAHSAERLATSVRPLESARSLEEAFAQANGIGTPGQNMVAADRTGRIGWSVYGAIPRRVGFDGRLPASRTDGARRWDGWLGPTEYPRVVDPPNGRIWTANARVVDGDMLDKLGDGSYEIGSRARLIRDRLLARERFTPRDLLDIQLDANGEFLSRWRTLLLSALPPAAIAGNPGRALFREIVDTGWTGRATPDSAAYRLVRSFREVLSARVIAFVLSECYEADPSFDYTNVRRRDAAIWRLATEQPQHLLDPEYSSWSELILEGVDQTIQQAMDGQSGDLRDRVWSEYNRQSYRHPLSAALPFVGRWLDMPSASLPGDLYTPRVQWGAIGASERMVVSPGKEAQGIMHMPTGQSGHPLSPFYAASHEAWVSGAPTPFLPGAAVHTLTLTP